MLEILFLHSEYHYTNGTTVLFACLYSLTQITTPQHNESYCSFKFL